LVKDPIVIVGGLRMVKTLSLYEAKTNLSTLVEEAAAGEEIVIAKNGRPKARLVALPPAAAKPRPFGLYRGRIRFAEDLEAPWPEDVRRALEGEAPIEPDDAPPSG
jgi:prevent-host-death family protein